MIYYIKAEHMKLRHTFGERIPLLAPCIMLLLTLMLTAGLEGSFPAGAWNWWYSLLLSGSLSLLCYLSVEKDKKIKYRGILLLASSPEKCWLGKIFYCSLGLLLSNVIIYFGTLFGGAVLGTTISPLRGLCASFLLTLTYLWQVPLFLFLSARFGMLVCIFSSLVLSITGVLAADRSFWWAYPAAVPVRLMCPVLGLLPNGLPLPLYSALGKYSVIPTGLIISAAWFAVLSFATSFWFKHLEES